MGFNVGKAVGAAAGVGAKYLLEDQVAKDRAELMLSKEKALAEYRDELADKGETRQYEKDRDRAPELRQRKVDDAQAVFDARYKPENIAKEVESLKAMEGAKAEVALTAKVNEMLKEIEVKGKPEYLKMVREVAAASRDPMQQKLLGLQISQAELGLKDSKLKVEEQGKIRKLVEDGDMNGARELLKGQQLARGVDMDRELRAANLKLSIEKSQEAIQFAKQGLTTEAAAASAASDKYARLAVDPESTKTGWDPDNKNVYKGGRIIGSADSAEGARTMLGGAATPAPAPAAAKPATPAAPAAPSEPAGLINSDEFSAMVTDAKRNGRIGIDYLNNRLAEGGLTVQQRLAAEAAVKGKK